VKTKILLTVGLMVVFAVMAGYAQESPVKAKIDFAFKVEGKTLPAGNYEFTRDDNAMTFRVQGVGNEGAIASIMTRLSAEMHLMPREAHVVFDVVGDSYILSEIWLPAGDGYLVAATKGPHTHKTVKAKK
jgi:hypothetical protein